MRHRLPILLLAGLMALGGCGGDPHEDASTSAAGTAADAAVPMAGDDPLPPLVELAAEHLDPLARGLKAENDHLAQAVQRLQSADSDAAQLRALSDIEAERLDAIGAEAAGLESHDYRRLRDALYEHLGAVETRAALEAQYRDADTNGMDEATAAEARRQAAEVMAAIPDPYADLDPALADALRQRQAELAGLRATHIGLLFKAVDG
jgi:hypothetical protein